MTQWTHNFNSHTGQERRSVRCASMAALRALTLGLSKDNRGVIAPTRPPG